MADSNWASVIDAIIKGTGLAAYLCFFGGAFVLWGQPLAARVGVGGWAVPDTYRWIVIAATAVGFLALLAQIVRFVVPVCSAGVIGAGRWLVMNPRWNPLSHDERLVLHAYATHEGWMVAGVIVSILAGTKSMPSRRTLAAIESLCKRGFLVEEQRASEITPKGIKYATKHDLLDKNAPPVG